MSGGAAIRLTRVIPIFFFFFSVCPEAATSQSVVVNGGMELWESGALFPRGWGTSAYGEASCFSIHPDALGKNSMQICFPQKSGHCRLNTPLFEVNSKTRYRLRFFYKGQGTLRWVLLVPKGIMPSDKSPECIHPVGKEIYYTELKESYWARREALFEMPEGAEGEYSLHFSFYDTAGENHLLIDEVSLGKASSEETGTWCSELVGYDASGSLVYSPDETGFRLPDFSFAGYRASEMPLPGQELPVKITLAPVAGDNTNHLQGAIAQLENLPLAGGIRGVLELKPGVYPVAGQLFVRKSGIVIRGSGSGTDAALATIIRATGNRPVQRTLLTVGNSSGTNDWNRRLSPDVPVVDEELPVGTHTLRVADVSCFQEGQRIMLRHDATQRWLDAIDGGVGHSGATPWTPDDNHHIVYNRRILHIDATLNQVTVDAPVFNTLKKSNSAYYIYAYDESGIVTECGVEHLRLESEYDASVQTTDSWGTYAADENHAWGGIGLKGVRDCWVRNVVCAHFAGSSFAVTQSVQCTFEDCGAIDPVSVITGERRYGFNTHTNAQQILFNRCYGREGRHHFISNGTSSASGNVFLDCTSENAYASSEGHRRWSSGFLFDNYRELAYRKEGMATLSFHNRGSYGTSHGWGLVTGVAWNCDLTAGNPASGWLLVQQPPTGQNYAIGCRGARIDGKGPFAAPVGYVEGANRAGLHPVSLFAAQLEDRTKGSTRREDALADGVSSARKVRVDAHGVVQLCLSAPARIALYRLNGQCIYHGTGWSGMEAIKVPAYAGETVLVNILPEQQPYSCNKK